MTFKTNVLLVALLALCLAVPAVNGYTWSAVYDDTTHTLDLGVISSDEVITVTGTQGESSGGFIYLSSSIYINGELVYSGNSPQSSYIVPLRENNSTFSAVDTLRNTNAGGSIIQASAIARFNYVISDPTPEPTPGPVNPYISVTELYSDNLGTVYRLQCLPSGDTIRYSNIVPYIIPAYMAPAYAGELTSSQTSIEYRVPAGGTSEFSAVYATAPLTVGVISTTVTAPPLIPAENQTYNPIPDPAQKPLTPFTSGKFQPTLTSGQVDVISKSPYLALLSNLNQTMQLPIMESPESIRNKLVPDDLENITGPLYDTAAGWAEFTNFIPRLIADTMIGVYSPFLSAIADCKSVLLSFTGQLAELMKPVYILSPVFYLFIPDLVWIGVCLVLVLLIIHALLVFVLGEDTVVYFMGRDTIVADAIPDFPALEK